MEEWKDISEFEGYYKVSNLGNVWSCSQLIRHKPKMLKGSIDYHGYLRVQLGFNGNKKFSFVHRLVAKAFIENPYNKPEVNHIDCNPLNNKVDNLEWVTHKENMEHALKEGRMDRTSSWLKNQRNSMMKYDKPVVGVNVETGKRIKFKSIQEAGRNGFRAGDVCRCCKGQRKTHAGYLWHYGEENNDNKTYVQ